MDLDAFDYLLNRTPVVLTGSHPALIAYLDEPVWVCSSLDELVQMFDSTSPALEQRIVILDPQSPDALRFPSVKVEHDPFTPMLNRVLFERYDFIATWTLTHARVAERILREARRVKTVVLVLLDGLSYADCRDWPGVEPCLAAAPTITRVGFPTIIGTPPLATRLFAAGLNRRVGFTYWSRESEPLTKRLFHAIAETHRLDSNHPDAFEQVLDWLSCNDLSSTYVQIVRTALDDFAEGHRTTVPRDTTLSRIRRDLDRVSDVLVHKGLPALLFAVADHGVLWKDEAHTIERIDFQGARYAEARSGPGRGRCFEVEGRCYWVLDYPQMGRAWKSNEQGIHGGISFEESIVPFLQLEVNSSC